MDLTSFRVSDDCPVVEPLPQGLSVVFQDGEVVAFDQSIASTGWVFVRCLDGVPHVLSCGTIAVTPDGYPKGHEGSLLRTDALAEEVDVLLQLLPTLPVVVHELPPVVTGKMNRPEVSLMTAVAIRTVARMKGLRIVTVSNQHSKKVIAGNGNADKKQWHAALETLPWTHEGRPTNEGQRDALALALTYLIDKESE